MKGIHFLIAAFVLYFAIALVGKLSTQARRNIITTQQWTPIMTMALTNGLALGQTVTITTDAGGRIIMSFSGKENR